MFTRLQYVKMEFPQFSSLTQQLSRVPSSVIHNFYLIGCGVADTDLEIFDGQIITTSEEQKYLCRAVGNLLRGGAGEKNNTSNVMYSNTLLLLTKKRFFQKKVFLILYCSFAVRGFHKNQVRHHFLFKCEIISIFKRFLCKIVLLFGIN